MIYLKYVFNNEYNGNIESLSKEMAYKHYNKNNLTIKRNESLILKMKIIYFLMVRIAMI